MLKKLVKHFNKSIIASSKIIKMSQSSQISKEICEMCFKSKKGLKSYSEAVVCKQDDLAENEMKVFAMENGGEVLVVRQNGEVHALGSKCTHYGAPLCKGVLGNNRIRCPYHGACFELHSGDIEDFPGLDSLPKYNAFIKNGNIVVRADNGILAAGKQVKKFVTRNLKNKTAIIVVGGGPAGTMCVQTLREEGFSGQIIFVTNEYCLPYDRVKLSKMYSVDANSIKLRCIHFYDDRNIEVRLGVSLESIDITETKIRLSNGENLFYDKLFLATGASAKNLEVSGSNLKNIFTLRQVKDAEAISNVVSRDSHVVVIGGSFIAIEIASVLTPIVQSITVVARSVPFQNTFGDVVGQQIVTFMKENGVKFVLKTTVKSFEGSDGRLTKIRLQNGTELKADICILGIGSQGNTGYFSKIRLESDGSIEVDEYLRTGLKNIYAGGDIAYAPVMDTKATVCHWQIATYHGKIAALNMLGKQTKLKSIPFFWTVILGKPFRYCGLAPNFNTVEIRGDFNGMSFVAFFVDVVGTVTAVLTVEKDPVAAYFAECLSNGEKLPVSHIDSWLSKAQS